MCLKLPTCESITNDAIVKAQRVLVYFQLVWIYIFCLRGSWEWKTFRNRIKAMYNTGWTAIFFFKFICLFAAPRSFSVDAVKNVRDWRKNKTELQCLSEEDSDRARLPFGGRKKASKELEISMRGWVISKRARHERVSRKMIRAMAKQMYTTVSDSRDEEFATSAGWLNLFLRRNNFSCRRMPENSLRGWRSLLHFHPGFLRGRKHLSLIVAWSQINVWSVKWLKQINAPAIIWYVTVC